MSVTFDHRPHGAHVAGLASQLATYFYAVRTRRFLTKDALDHGDVEEAERHRDYRRHYARSLRRVLNKPGGKQALELYRKWEKARV